MLAKIIKKESCLTLQLLSVKCLHEQTSSSPSPKLNLTDSRPSFSVISIHLDGCLVTELDLIHVAQLIRLQSYQYVHMQHLAQSQKRIPF